MSNWNYARDTPTSTWRSAMTLPREISLVKEGDQYFIKNNVIPSFEKYTTNVVQKDVIDLKEKFVLENENFNQTELSFKVNLADDLNIEYLNGLDESILFIINPTNKELVLDRRKSGQVYFEERFAEKAHIMPYSSSNREVAVRIILDWSSIEVFIDNGRYVMTDQIFPNEFYNLLEISSSKQTELKQFNLNTIKTIW